MQVGIAADKQPSPAELVSTLQVAKTQIPRVRLLSILLLYDCDTASQTLGRL